jgi:hypothetical protein
MPLATLLGRRPQAERRFALVLKFEKAGVHLRRERNHGIRKGVSGNNVFAAHHFALGDGVLWNCRRDVVA